jgi:LysR family transcriptional regulator, hydrogen peroxide-inducible genes activator
MQSRLNFSLTQLEYALAVRKHGHFAKAAEACHITQPTLSMQIQKLEEDLGVVLFDRSKKPILLTPAGEALIEQMQSVIFEAKKIGDLAQRSRTQKATGVLTVGIIPTVAPAVLPRLLATMAEHFPGLELNIRELQTQRIVEALGNDEIDVGLLATPMGLSKVHEFPLYYEPFSVVAHHNHPLAKLKKVRHSNLTAEDIWLLQEGHCLRAQVLDVCELKGKAKSRKFNFESGSLETLINLVKNFGGYTLLPALSVRDLSASEVRELKIIPFDRPIPAREIGLVYRREHYKADLIEGLGEAILASLPAEIRKIRPKDLAVLPVREDV